MRPRKKMKTNKSYTKRLKTTRRGKLVARVPGQNHFNAKESRAKHMYRKRLVAFHMSNKARSRFLP